MNFKKYIVCVLLLTFMFPIVIKAAGGEACQSYTLSQVNVGTKNTVCIASTTAQSGNESHHRFVKNMHSSLKSILVVNTVIYMGDGSSKAAVPVYCVNENKHGVGDKALNSPKTYSVTLRDWNYFVNLVGSSKANYIRNIILNGYPTKSAAELGFTANSAAENNYDAFTATKLSVFTVLNAYGYSLSNDGLTYYQPATINDGGKRGTKIVQKIKDLLVYSKKTPPNGLSVAFTEKGSATSGNYVVKTVSANPPMGGTLTVTLQNAPSGTLIDGVAATSKTITNSGYYGKQSDIKISVPLSSVQKSGMNMTINMNYKYTTYDIFYGDSGTSYQSYLVPKPVNKTAQATYSFKYTPKVRTCDDVKTEYNACNSKGNCTTALINEYDKCFPKPKRTCDDVKGEYEACNKDGNCSKELISEYDKCFPKRTCDDVKGEYDVCNKEGNCSQELVNEYDKCFPKRTCDDVKSEYVTCSVCSQVKLEYDTCSKSGTCSAELINKYKECNGLYACSNELTNEYNQCFPKERTCGDVIDEYIQCSKNNTCSDSLTNEYNKCAPLEDEENPDTMGANIVLIVLALLGGSIVILRTSKRRREIASELN